MPSYGSLVCMPDFHRLNWGKKTNKNKQTISCPLIPWYQYIMSRVGDARTLLEIFRNNFLNCTILGIVNTIRSFVYCTCCTIKIATLSINHIR